MNLDIIGDILFPPACLGCSGKLHHGVLCSPCQKSIDLFDTLFCSKCAARLPDGKKICHAEARYLLGTAGSYDDNVLQALIHALKFQGIKGAAAPLAQVLIDYAEKVLLDIKDFTVIPLPLSEKRRRARGFNQSELIARPFATHFALPLETAALVRISHRKPQSETESIVERKENIRGCFSINDATKLAGKKILLIDDVTTSGTTFNEAIRVLIAAGAKKIIALAVAQA